MFEWAITNTLETVKNKSLIKEIKFIRKGQMRILELKNMITRKKYFSRWLNSRMEGINKRISELQDRGIKIKLPNLKREKKKLKEIIIVSENCGTI